jgi:multidrug efflux pump subunit AcrA (membrane-fusion protein)
VSRRAKAEARAQALQIELLRAPASSAQTERRAVTEQQLAEALADRQGADDELARLELRAQTGGTVRDLATDVVPGRWVNPRQPLLRVVSARSVIEAYVSESQVRAVEPGQSIRFYPEQAGGRLVRARGGASAPGLGARRRRGRDPEQRERGGAWRLRGARCALPRRDFAAGGRCPVGGGGARHRAHQRRIVLDRAGCHEPGGIAVRAGERILKRPGNVATEVTSKGGRRLRHRFCKASSG